VAVSRFPVGPLCQRGGQDGLAAIEETSRAPRDLDAVRIKPNDIQPTRGIASLWLAAWWRICRPWCGLAVNCIDELHDKTGVQTARRRPCG